MVGRSESRKPHPSLCIMVVRWKKKSTAFYVPLFARLPAVPQPNLRLFGVKETIPARRKLVRGKLLWSKNVSKPGDRTNSSKTKEVVEEVTLLCPDPSHRNAS